MAYEVHKADQQHMEYLKSGHVLVTNVGAVCPSSDKQYMVCWLVPAMNRTTRLSNEQKDLDGIMAWIQMTRICDNGGSIDLRIKCY
jgi:hypothetical protein